MIPHDELLALQQVWVDAKAKYDSACQQELPHTEIEYLYDERFRASDKYGAALRTHAAELIANSRRYEKIRAQAHSDNWEMETGIPAMAVFVPLVSDDEATIYETFDQAVDALPDPVDAAIEEEGAK